MPESRKRKNISTQTVAENKAHAENMQKMSPRWWAPVMVALLLLGLLCLVITYLSQAYLPVPGLGQWNLAFGFGLMVLGLLMSMGWK